MHSRAPLPQNKKAMRQNIIAIMATVAAFAANTEFVNAQNEQVINNLKNKAEVYWASEGPQTKNVVTEAGQKTYIYDRDDFEISVPAVRENGKADTLKIKLNKAIRRNPTSGVAFGIDAGGVMLAENFSPAAGFHITMSWKKIDMTGGFLGATNVYNEESSKAGKRFFAGMAYGELGYNARFKMRGYNNQGVIVPFVGYMFIFDKNANDLGETATAVEGGTIYTTSEYDVKGNSSAIYGGVKARISLKHMGGMALTAKVFGGVYQRYYLEGSKRKPFAGVTIGLEFSGAKKRVDSDVNTLQKSLENGDYELANQFINNLRASSMK